MSPSEALGAFTEYLDRRFREMGADFQNKLLDGMKWEDKLLNQYIAKNRLSEWLRTALEHAQQEVGAVLEEEDDGDVAVEEEDAEPAEQQMYGIGGSAALFAQP
jgi:hypothetical protein